MLIKQNNADLDLTVTDDLKLMKLQNEYGFLQYELYILIGLNDFYRLKFRDFKKIIENAPKSYNNFDYCVDTIPIQRLIDSLVWFKYIKKNFKDKRCVKAHRGRCSVIYFGGVRVTLVNRTLHSYLRQIQDFIEKILICKAYGEKLAIVPCHKW